MTKTNKENKAFTAKLPPILNAKEYKSIKDEILEDLEEEDLDDEPTDYEMITNNSVGICYHDGCM